MRKSIDVTISAQTAPSSDGRDYGKTFRITEMSAYAADEWGMRATLALIPRLSREVSADVAEALKENPGMSSTAQIGQLLGGITFPEVKELLAELLGCVSVVTDISGRIQPRQLNLGGMEDIEDVETLHYLREEALKLHTGFTFAAAIFNLVAAFSMSLPPELTSTSQE